MSATSTNSTIRLALGIAAALTAASCAAYVATGSAALLSLAAHTLIVASSLALLLFGSRRARRAPPPAQPPPAASDLHFWSFVAPLLLLSMGAGLSLFAGVDRLHDPRPIVEPVIAHAVLGASAIAIAASIWRAIAAYDARGLWLHSFAALRLSGEPVLFSVLVQGLSVLTSTAVAVAGVLVAHRLAVADADGLAAIAIGLVMAATAALLALETRVLLASHPIGATTPRRVDAAAGDGEPRADDRDASTIAVHEQAPSASMTMTHDAPRPSPYPAVDTSLDGHPNRKARKKSKRRNS